MATNRPKLTFLRGGTYTFDVSAAALATHPFKFTADSGATEYTTGVTLTGTQGQAGASLSITVSDSAPNNLNYYCGDHGLSKGNHIMIPDPVPIPPDSDGDFVASPFRSHLNVTAAAGTLYTGSAGTVYYMAVDEGVPAVNDSDGTFFTDSDIIVTTDSDYQYGGGHDLVFNIEGPVTIAWGGARGLIAGGYTAGNQKSNTIDYINISTPGNATDFGDLTVARYSGATMSNATRAVFGGGIVVNNSDVLDYVTVATPGNAIDFGDMSATWAYIASEGDGTYGVMASGYRFSGQSLYNDIEYITIDTPSNSTSFGNLSGNQTGRAMGTNGTIGVITTGNDGSGSAYSNSMLTITMATPGNAVVSSGTLLDSWTYVQNLPGDNTYLLVGAGRRSNGEDANGWTNMVEKFATATQTGATDHGDLTNSGGMSAASSDGTYAFWAGREGSNTPSGQSNGRYHTIEQMSIATGGNSTDFGTISEYIEAGFGSSGNAA